MKTLVVVAFSSLRIHWAFILLLGSAGMAAGQLPCVVDTSHDGNGLYTYSFRRGELPYVWGLTTNKSINMQFYGIREIETPPGWSNSVSETGWITWTRTAELIFLDDPVTFSVRSCLAETTTYDKWSTDFYYRGVILGSVYELPARTNNLGGGYQTFVFTGPALPTLSVAHAGSQVALSWSSLSRECQLECSDVLQPPLWTPVTNSPALLGTNFTVTLPAVNSTRIFRLAVENIK